MSRHSLRKAVRFLHLAVNGAWLGAVLSCLLLVQRGSPRQPAPYLSAFWLHDNVVIWVAGVVLFTGLYFSLYAPWGLVWEWWIVAKWIGLTVLALGKGFAGGRLGRVGSRRARPRPVAKAPTSLPLRRRNSNLQILKSNRAKNPEPARRTRLTPLRFPYRLA
jgi:hypothetical protein